MTDLELKIFSTIIENPLISSTDLLNTISETHNINDVNGILGQLKRLGFIRSSSIDRHPVYDSLSLTDLGKYEYERGIKEHKKELEAQKEKKKTAIRFWISSALGFAGLVLSIISLLLK